MKITKTILMLIFLIIILIYVSCIDSIPKSILLLDGEKLNVATILGVNIKEKNNEYTTIQTSSNINNNSLKQTTAEVNLFNTIKVKEIDVNTIPITRIVPLGNVIGLKLYTNGVLVIGKTEIQGQKPYENTSIEEGDMIIEIDEKTVTCTADLVEFVNESNGNNIKVTYIKDGETVSENMKPAKNQKNEYKLGLWVRDGAAGIGTITYYDPETKQFSALGHGITDIDTEKLIKIASGEIVTSTISSIQKGEENKPGQIKGGIAYGKKIGIIDNNTEFGIYGKLTDTTSVSLNENNSVEVASRDEIEKGPAKVILTLENDIRKEYDIEIKKVYKNNNYNNKSMLIEVKDEELLQLTGGIIQGMSGAPIIQNGKLIGAVTHVLVSDPTSGYAVFGDLMIKEMKKID